MDLSRIFNLVGALQIIDDPDAAEAEKAAAMLVVDAEFGLKLTYPELLPIEVLP